MVSRIKKNKEKRKEIEDEKKEARRRKILNVIMKIFIILMVLLVIMFISLRYIGNYGIIVKENVVVNKKVPDNFQGLKIVQFTDLHYGISVNEKKLNQLVKEINRINPDLIVFTGDLIDSNYPLNKDEIKKLTKALSEMNATLGKYSVEGNHDNETSLSIIKDAGFIILDNSYDLIYKDNYTPILINGLSSSLLKNMDIDKAFSYFSEDGSNQDIFTITLLHEPDNVLEILTDYNTDLVFAGHSHNGQIRLPKIGGIIKVNGARTYYDEYYKINNTELYISGGVGCSMYPFRLFNHPSINFIRVRQH